MSSDLKVTNIKHASSSSNNLVLASDGTTSFTGNVGIGTTNPSSFNSQARNLVVGDGSDHQGITIYSSTSTTGNIFFADGTSGSEPVMGGVNYNHSDNSMDFRTNDAPRLKIGSTGLLFSTATYANGQGGSPRMVSIESTGQMGYSSSGRRFKTNIEDIASSILLHKLRPVNYNFFEKIDGNWSETKANKYFQSGLIAEEVKEALTELGIQENNALYGEDENGIPNYVNYIGLIPYLIKGFQELSAKVTALENATN